jgi:hypothetical protein
MKTEIVKQTSGRKVAFIVLIIIISALVIFYTIMLVMGTGRKIAELKNEFGIKADENTRVEERIASDSTYLKLLKEKAFLQSRTVMAESDSIYLTINLEDSTSNIEISGVVVHKAKISSFQISKIFTKANENLILSMLSTPFTIAGSNATIKKEPVMIKMAPKDTSEYKPDIMPDTSFIEPVNYKLEMTNGTRIYVYQEENNRPGDRMNYFRFDFMDRLRDAWHSLKSVAVFKVPEYHLFIKIRIPRSDAKIIYRALPKNGQIGVYI